MKRTGLILTVIGFILFCHVEGWGADWKWYAFHPETGNFFYEAGSITHPSKGVVRVWGKTIYNEKGVIEVMGELGEKFKTLSHYVDLVEYHCAEKKTNILKITFYSTDGNVLFSADYQEPKWHFIVPESISENLYTILCK